jgi:excisionase family DNA binding protein
MNVTKNVSNSEGFGSQQGSPAMANSADTTIARPVLVRSVQIQPVPTQRLFGVGAAAHYLGVSDDTLRKYADLGQIPAFRFINGHRAFKLEDLNELIDSLPMWNDRTSDTARAGRDREVS